MSRALIGRKVGMSQILNEEGVTAATVIDVSSCVVTQKKTQKRDGYDAIQVGFGLAKPSRVNRPLRGHFQKHRVAARRVLKEFRVDDPDEYEEGAELGADLFREGDRVRITGTSKGRGFAGVMKRWGFSGGPGSHGTGHSRRRPGSIGASADPSRVFKGKKMAGHMGHARVSTVNVKVLKVKGEDGVLVVQGAVPGPNGGVVYVQARDK